MLAPHAAVAITPMQEADRLMQQERYLEAMVIIEKLAKDGEPVANFKLGQIYEGGLGVETDRRRARDAYQRAVDKGNQEARLALVPMLLKGTGGPVNRKLASQLLDQLAKETPPDLRVDTAKLLLALDGPPATVQQAVDLLSEAAAQGDVEALQSLAVLYEDGKRVPKDDRKALDYYLEAAEAGDPWSMLEYAARLKRPGGKLDDAKNAADWIGKAAALGLPEAQFRFGEVQAAGEGVAKDPALAAEWYERAHANGHSESGPALADLLMTGNGEARNVARAVELLKAAAEKGNVAAMLDLAEGLDANRFGASDKSAALSWLLRAAQLRDQAWLAETIADRFVKGEGTRVSIPQAMLWYSKAASMGSGGAHASLGEIYADGGGGIARDEEKAAEHFAIAANSGVVWAMTEYGRRLLDGTGVRPNWAAALQWLENAAAKGDETAPMLLLEAISKPSSGTATPGERLLNPLTEAGEKQGDGFAEGDAVLNARTKAAKENAIAAIQRLADSGHASAQFSLASIYYHGEGLAKDAAAAYFWWSLSALRGNEFAAIRKGQIAKEIGSATRRRLNRDVMTWQPSVENQSQSTKPAEKN